MLFGFARVHGIRLTEQMLICVNSHLLRTTCGLCLNHPLHLTAVWELLQQIRQNVNFAAAAWIELQMPSGFDFMDIILEQLFESRNYLFPASFSSVPLSLSCLCKKLFISVFFNFFSLSSYLYFSPFHFRFHSYVSCSLFTPFSLYLFIVFCPRRFHFIYFFPSFLVPFFLSLLPSSFIFYFSVSPWSFFVTILLSSGVSCCLFSSFFFIFPSVPPSVLISISSFFCSSFLLFYLYFSLPFFLFPSLLAQTIM